MGEIREIEQALSNQKTNDDELDYILDIGKHDTDTSGVIVDIVGHL